MKNFILAACSVIMLSSCATTMLTTYRDYSKYSEEGFFISPTPYYGEYTPCGEIFVSILPWALIEDNQGVSASYTNENGYNKYGNYVAGSTASSSKRYTPEQLIDEAVKKAKSQGADAIVNFEFNAVYNEKNSIIRYEISGFCIKRNDK